MTIQPWKKIKEETVWGNEYWEHRKATFELPDGQKQVFEYPWVRNGVMMVVVNEKGEVLIQTQYRPFIEGTCEEFPAGGMDKGETPLEAAERELAEEAKLKAGNWEDVGFFYPSPGSTNRKAFVFIASDLEEFEGLPGDEFELDHRFVTIKELEKMIEDGTMKDGWAIASWVIARPRVLKMIGK